VKIAVVELAGKGGLIHYAFQLCRAMAREGADVTLLTDTNYELTALDHPFRLQRLFNLWDPKPAEASSPPGRFRFQRVVRAMLYYREWLRLIAHLERERYDVVQFGDIRFPTDFYMLRQARKHVRLMADVCHNVRPFAGSGLFVASNRYERIYRLFDLVFVHHDVNRDEFLTRFPELPQRVRTIVHGNEEIFRELRNPSITPATLRKRLGLAPDDQVVLFFGSLSAYKGIDLLLDAFGRIARKHPRARLVVVGPPLADFKLEQQRGEKVQIVPSYIDAGEVAAWMEMAAVVVYPYREIHQSGALQIALTLGAPIVATRVGANAEVITDGISGLLVPPNDAAVLAEAISRLLLDRELARRIGDGARATAEDKFAWRPIARRMLEAYGGAQ
jgi:glycosyltransferase involved in cell wall biosynthesis